MFDSCMFVNDLNPGDCAAWVQAIGSVLAIVAAAMFILLQHHLDVKRARDADRDLTRRRLDVVAGAISSARKVITEATEFARLQQITLQAFQHANLRAQLEKSEQLLFSISKPDLPHFKIANVIMGLESDLAEARTLLDSMRNASPHQQYLLDRLVHCSENVEQGEVMLKSALRSKTFWPDADGEPAPATAR